MNYDVRINKEKCIFCEECVEVCPLDVFEIKNNEVVIISNDDCIGKQCLHCTEVCNENAITISPKNDGSESYNKAFNLYDSGHIEESKKLFYEALELGAEELNSDKKAYIAWAQIGSFFLINGDKEQSIKAYKNSLSFNFENDQMSLANNLTKLSEAFLRNNEFNEAIEYSRKAINIAANVNNDVLFCEATLVLGSSLVQIARTTIGIVSDEKGFAIMTEAIDNIIPGKILLDELINENQANFDPKAQPLYNYLNTLRTVYEEQIEGLEKFPVLKQLIEKKYESFNNENDNQEERKSKNKCFIASAVYDSPNAYEIIILKRFRDTILLKKKSGQVFISLYYYISPFIVKLIDKNILIKKIVKQFVVNPTVKFVENKFVLDKTR